MTDERLNQEEAAGALMCVRHICNFGHSGRPMMPQSEYDALERLATKLGKTVHQTLSSTPHLDHFVDWCGGAGTITRAVGSPGPAYCDYCGGTFDADEIIAREVVDPVTRTFTARAPKQEVDDG